MNGIRRVNAPKAGLFRKRRKAAGSDPEERSSQQDRDVIEIRKNIFLVPGDQGALFPFCNCVYIKGKDMCILIDAGMGRQGMDACARAGIDLLILSHCHYDHRSSIGDIPGVPVWSHAREACFIEDNDLFVEAMGLSRSGVNIAGLLKGLFSMKIRVARTLQDGEAIDAGGLTLRIIPVPGHSPGQIAIHVPEADFLFTADVSLHPFGPFYGHAFGDIEDSIRSICRLRAVGAGTVLSGHCGPFQDDTDRRFAEHEAIIHERDRRILERLSAPQAIEDLLGLGIIYSKQARLTRLMKWWERTHLEKHLERLVKGGEVEQLGDLFRRKVIKEITLMRTRGLRSMKKRSGMRNVQCRNPNDKVPQFGI